MALFDILNIKKSSNIVKEYQKIKSEKFVLSSGSKNFDKVLGRGFRPGKMYLIFGANKTGKTQLSHQMCLQAYKQFSKSIFIDAENTFRPERIRELAIANNLDYEKILKSILVARIMSNSALLLKLKEVEEQIKKGNDRVVIIDSINNHYRSEQGDKNISFNSTKTTFLKILMKLNELTKNFNLITIATAQVTPNFVDNAIVQEFPVGRQYLNHYFSEYLYLSYKEEERSYVHLVNSHLLPEKKVLYKITSKGIEDYKIL